MAIAAQHTEQSLEDRWQVNSCSKCKQMQLSIQSLSWTPG
jgi:hypothetical protein